MKTTGTIYYIMGVSGSGKSTIGEKLAAQLGLPFYDGDHYHPEENVAKMAAGHPLNDTDRQGWLERINSLAREQADQGAVIVCSALKKKYRKVLSKGLDEAVVWVYLKGSFELIMERLQARKGHFMPASLLESQFRTLEIPETAISVSIKNAPEKIVEKIISKLKKAGF